LTLTGFRYLRPGRLTFLLTLLTLSSALFSITLTSLVGFYGSFSSILDSGGDVLAVYGRGSRTPFTGLVPLQLSSALSNVSGVLASSPEVLAPCVLEGRPVFLRAVVPEEFLKVQQVKVVEGVLFEFSWLDSAAVGCRLAGLLNLKVGDRILVRSALVDRYVELQVVGVFESNSPLDDEVLAPLYVGQWLRGSGYSHVTFVRLKVDPSSFNLSKAVELLGSEASSVQPEARVPPPLPRIVSGFRAGDVGVEYAGSLMEGYLERYGLSRDTLLALSIAVFLFSSACVALACETLLVQHSGELEVLRSLGVSRRLLKMDIVLKLTPISLAASALGFTLSYATLQLLQNHIMLLSHGLKLGFDLPSLALTFTLSSAIVFLSVWRAELK